jgi:hypothetical protein
MSTKMEALPLPQARANSWQVWPMALLAAILLAVGVASYFALRHNEPASSSTAVYENSGVVTGSGPALAELAKQFAAYQSSGPIIGTGPGLAELAQRFAAYRNSGLIGGTGPALAELRGVDVIGIGSAGLTFPSLAALENQFGGAAIAASGLWPSAAALENQFGGAITFVSSTGASVAESRGVDVVGITRPGFSRPGPGASEGASAGSKDLRPVDTCLRVHHGPC